MATLQEILENDLGLGSEKTASQKSRVSTEDADLNKLAMELGLSGDLATDSGEEETTSEKTASASGLTGLYETLFPEDGGVEKVAEQDKEAAYQEALGARTHGYFADRFEQRVEKLAMEAMTGSVHEDATPPQEFPTNKKQRDEGGDAIDTAPQVTDEVSKGDDDRVVGHYEQKKAMAVRKHLLLQQLQG